MKTLLTLLLLAASAFGQTATISDTIRTPFGGTFSGTVTVTLNSPALAQPLYSGSVTLSGWTQAVTVTAGVFTLTLYTNDLITPGGTSYTATYAPTSGSGWKETWIVPTGATTIREIRSTTVPSPSVRFTPSQITQAGATLGQGLKWDGSKWAPADVVANPMTTNGDLITRLGGVPVRVGIGSTNQVLTVAGGMPVWASGITGNASTASALAANGANCTAGSFPLGVDASGNAESCTAAVTASTGLSDSAALVRNNQANTYTAGSKQTFASNATTAGAAFGGGITADPSSVTAGDFWYRTDLGTFGFRNASAVDALVAGGRALSTVGSVPFVTSGGVLGQDAGLAWDSTNKQLSLFRNSADASRIRISNTNGAAQILVTATGATQIRNEASGQPIIFEQSTERARFAATSGNLLLGTTTDDGVSRLQVNGNLIVNGGNALRLQNAAGNQFASMLLNANSIVTVNYPFSVGPSSALTSAVTFGVHDGTPTTGSTSLVVRAGAGQSGYLTDWRDSSNNTSAYVQSQGNIYAFNEFQLSTTARIMGPTGSFRTRSAGQFQFSSDTTGFGAPDAAFGRFAAGRIELNSGTAIGTTPANARDIMLRRTFAAETTTDPSAADLTIAGSNAQDVAAIYVKNDKLVVAYNRSGTVNYLTIPLDGATTIFTQSTTAP